MQVSNWEIVTRKLTKSAREFLDEAYGLELGIPVGVNGRLKNTYGRFVHRDGWIGKQPLRIEIGKNYVENQDWETVIQTLKHECIHYALYVLNKPYKDGQTYFENELQKHGSHSTGTVKYRGKVVEYGCPSCNKVWRKKKRYPRNGEGYQCTKCDEQIVFLGEKTV